MDAAEIDRELGELEGKVEHLRALYEQYFMGFDRLEPLVHRRDVERRVGALRREQLRNTAQRFKFNTIVQRLNTMQQHWARVVREIENGTYRRDVIRAAARFGEGALTALGKKKTRALAAAVAREQAKRTVEEAFELGADDLIEDEEDAPTPPRPISAPPTSAPPPTSRGALPPAKPGLGLLPRLSAQPKRSDEPRPDPGDAARVKLPASLQATEHSIAPTPPHVAVRAPLRDAGAATKPVAFGELDLELDDALQRGGARPGQPVMPAARPVGRALASPVKVSATAAGIVTPHPGERPSAFPDQAAAAAGFEDLDLPFGEPLAKPAISPAPLVRPAPARPADAVARPSPPTTKRAEPSTTAAARPAASAPKPGPEGDLPDQRIRQIYAKYVETRRSTQESTAGITFEKLASSLRAQADKLRSAHPTRSIDYEVVVKDGKTHLKPVLR